MKFGRLYSLRHEYQPNVTSELKTMLFATLTPRRQRPQNKPPPYLVDAAHELDYSSGSCVRKYIKR